MSKCIRCKEKEAVLPDDRLSNNWARMPLVLCQECHSMRIIDALKRVFEGTEARA